jgi:hypothetical protein
MIHYFLIYKFVIMFGLSHPSFKVLFLIRLNLLGFVNLVQLLYHVIFHLLLFQLFHLFLFLSTAKWPACVWDKSFNTFLDNLYKIMSFSVLNCFFNFSFYLFFQQSSYIFIWVSVFPLISIKNKVRGLFYLL